jgi:hypothetical protein
MKADGDDSSREPSNDCLSDNPPDQSVKLQNPDAPVEQQNKVLIVYRQRELNLRCKSFRLLKVLAVMLDILEKIGGFSRLADNIPFLNLISSFLVALCDILRFHFQRIYRKQHPTEIVEAKENEYNFGHKRVLRFRAVECISSCLKLVVNLVGTILQFVLPGAENILKAISLILTPASSVYTLNDDTCKFAHRVKYNFIKEVTNPFVRAGLLFKKINNNTLTPSEYREIHAFTGKVVFTAVGFVAAALAIAAFVMGPFAPIGLAVLAVVISAIGIVGYTGCSITKAAFDVIESKAVAAALMVGYNPKQA